MNTEPISGIKPIQNAVALNTTQKAGGSATSVSDGIFADIFQTAINNVKTTDADMNEAQYLLATGQLDNPAEATIAAAKATSAVELLVQLRNRRWTHTAS